MLREDGKAVAHLRPGSSFDADLGLSSFQVVELVARIGGRLGIDLARVPSVTDIGTVADLSQACRDALAGKISSPAPADDLRAVRERAQARRLSSPPG
jgi:acyl carrier protein